MTMTPNGQLPPLRGADLESWRTNNNLSKPAACEAFGIQLARWADITSPERRNQPLQEPILALLLYLYIQFPEASPINKKPNIRKFYYQLGLHDTPGDRELFATLVGLTTPSAYRLIMNDGNPSRPVLRWVEALQRMQLEPKKCLETMKAVVEQVAVRQNVQDVLNKGWSKSSERLLGKAKSGPA